MQQVANNFGVMDISCVTADVTFDDHYKLRLSSKKLKSGKCQVKFYATVHERKDLYGYVLVDSGQTLKDVVVRIKDKLNTIQRRRDFQHIHLYSIGKTNQDDLNFIIFDS
ncbi:MAG: hypothetical protein KI790_04060 [Cyclobacteriaceae bacterium]|nr:hypothetical protein [Cyclobacteriaceae bacterium HetDA_MAG_MS6]